MNLIFDTIESRLTFTLKLNFRNRREDDCDDIDECYKHRSRKAEILVHQYYTRVECAGRNVMVCKDCTLTDLTGLWLHDRNGSFEVADAQSLLYLLQS